MRVLAAVAGLIVLVVGALILMDAITPNSTSGVNQIGDNTARLPVGQEMILTHTVGKSIVVWHITYDGDSTVHIDEDLPLLAEHNIATLCGAGCTTDVDMGSGNHILLTQQPEGAVDVQWPSSWFWGFRPYKS